jgi:hypothetical protein
VILTTLCCGEPLKLLRVAVVLAQIPAEVSSAGRPVYGIRRISDILSLSACSVSNNSTRFLFVDLLPHKTIFFPALVSQANFSRISMLSSQCRKKGAKYFTEVNLRHFTRVHIWKLNADRVAFCSSEKFLICAEHIRVQDTQRPSVQFYCKR